MDFRKRWLLVSGIRFLLTLFVVVVMLSGCGEGRGSFPWGPLSPPGAKIQTTPAGFKMAIGQVSPVYSQTWIIFDEQVGEEFFAYSLDQKISDCMAIYNNQKGLLEKARGITYEVFNDYAFSCPESDTGLCAGWTNKKDLIKATFYAKRRENEYPVFQTHPALIRTKEQMYTWSGGIKGWLTLGSNYYASDLWAYNWDYEWIGAEVVCHELQHCWSKIADSARLDAKAQDEKNPLSVDEREVHYIIVGF